MVTKTTTYPASFYLPRFDMQQIEDWCIQCGKDIPRIKGEILTLEEALYCKNCIQWWKDNPPHDLRKDQMPIMAQEDQEQDELEKTEDPKRDVPEDDDDDNDEGPVDEDDETR